MTRDNEKVELRVERLVADLAAQMADSKVGKMDETKDDAKVGKMAESLAGYWAESMVEQKASVTAGKKDILSAVQKAE